MKLLKLILLFFIIISLSACQKSMTTINEIRLPAVAGQFYPANPELLNLKLEEYLTAANPQKQNGKIKAIIVPHAGYDFSGPVAAYAYKLLTNQEIDNVIIICNSHTSYFEGIAIDNNDAWQTPLGIVELNHDLAARLVNYSDLIYYNKKVHITEHSLEIQIPFLQKIIKNKFKIVPILFGNATHKSYIALAKALAENIGDNDLIVISTDMSHYPSYNDAQQIDTKTLKIIKEANISKLEEYIENILSQNIPGEQTLLCGIDGVKTVIELYHLLNWDEIKILKYANSGDSVIGDKKQVVGYGAVAFIQKKQNQNGQTLTEEQKNVLRQIAKQTVETYILEGKIPEFNIKDKRLNWREGVFVTLKKNGKLRGCIGQIIPGDKPLWKVVRDMAIEAATQDPRFQPVSKEELNDLEYEISVLSKPQKIDDWKKIQLEKHGVIVRRGFNSGVFLPQVAEETDWTLEEFLSHLCYGKAGLEPECYKDPQTELFIFTAQVF